MGDELTGYAAKRRRKILLRALFLGLIVLLLLGVSFYFLCRYYFVARSVTVEECSLYSAESLLQCLDVAEGTPLISLSKKEMERRIENEFPYLTDVNVSFQLPQGVYLSFEEKLGVLCLNLGEEYFMIDEEMNVLAKETEPDTLGRIRLRAENVTRCVVGEKISFRDTGAFQSLSDLLAGLKSASMREDVGEIDIRDKFHIRLHYLDRFTVLIGDSSELKYKLSMTKSVIKELEENSVGVIDVVDPDLAYVTLDEPLS